MPWLLAIGALALLVGAFVYSRKSEAAMPQTPSASSTLDLIFLQTAEKYDLDPLLLKAIALVESSLKGDAVRWNPPRDVSVGLMQILCTPPDGTNNGEDYVCRNAFNITPWPVTFEQLKNPELNIDLGAQILSWNMRQFGFPRGIAVYNQWSARNSAVNGPFPNQGYVDKVLQNYSALKGEFS